MNRTPRPVHVALVALALAATLPAGIARAGDKPPQSAKAQGKAEAHEGTEHKAEAAKGGEKKGEAEAAKAGEKKGEHETEAAKTGEKKGEHEADKDDDKDDDKAEKTKAGGEDEDEDDDEGKDLDLGDEKAEKGKPHEKSANEELFGDDGKDAPDPARLEHHRKMQKAAARREAEKILEGKPMRPEVRAELERHALMTAKLMRIGQLARSNKDKVTIGKVRAAAAKEVQHHGEVMSALKSKAGTKGGAE